MVANAQNLTKNPSEHLNQIQIIITNIHILIWNPKLPNSTIQT